MKLNYIYSNKTFKEIKFNSGLNLIVAEVTDKMNLNIDSHNLGKSTLISIIDFMLLKTLDKNHIFKRHADKFKDHIFFLQIEYIEGQYITIRRSVNKSSKVSFQFNEIPYENLLEHKDWTESNLAFDKAKLFLNNLLEFEVLKDWNYRKSLTYFLRSQDDYRDVFQLAKFSSGKDVDWKPFIFDMLNFNGNILKEKYELALTKEKQKELIKILKNQSSVDSNESDKLVGAIEMMKDEITEVTKKIDDFSFYKRERHLNKNLIENIEENISKFNSQEYDLTYEKQEIEKSLKRNSLVDFDVIKDLYNEIGIHFESQIEKSYEELTEFNRQITIERTKYLKLRLNALNDQIVETRKQITFFDSQRNDALSSLKDKDSFNKFKTYQKELALKEGEIVRFQQQLKNLDKIQNIRNEIKITENEIDEKIEEIRKLISGSENVTYQNIRKHFRNIIKYILNTPAILYLTQNSLGNVEYHAEIQKENELEITSESKGYSYKKLLCVAYDLAILIEYSTSKFYNFVYHDGIFEGLDNRKKINFVLLARVLTEKYNLQYIFTAIQDDLPDLKSVGKENISESEICLRLNDKDASGTLLGFAF